MSKKYKQLKDSWFSSAGDIWEQDKYDPTLYVHQKTQKVVSQREVDDSPNWFEEVQEKKIVKRWRAKKWESYNTLYCVDREDQHQVDSQHYDQGEYFASTQVSNRAQKRVKIMCRLMGLAETIEEGSTEMRKGWIMSYSQHVGMWRCLYKDEIVPTIYLATFSTRALAQLFLDSAGQDAIDWYGAVK